MGLLALGVQYYTTQALLNEKASVVGVVGNSAVIFSIIIEVILGHGFPDFITLMGMGVDCVGGVRGESPRQIANSKEQRAKSKEQSRNPLRG